MGKIEETIKTNTNYTENEFAECIVNTLREPLLVLDKELRVIKASRSFYSFFRVTPEETIGKQIYNLGNHLWDIPELRELLETILPEKITADDYKINLYIPDIGKYDLLLNASQIQIGAEKEKIVFLAFNSTTGSRSSETDVKSSEDEFRIITENSADAIFILNAEGRYTYVNDRAVRLLGYSKEEMLQLTIADISPKNRLGEYFEIFRKTLLEGSVFAELELIKKDGSVIPTDLNATLLPNDFIYGSCRDITDRKSAEEKLQESEEKYRELVEGSPDGIIIHREGKIVFANRASVSMMRASSIDELIGKSVFDFVHPSYKEIAISKMIEMNKTGKALPFTEEKFIRLDDSEVDVEVKAVPIVHEKKSAVQIIVRDITERKQIESALKTSEERFRTAVGNLTDVIYEWDIKQKLDWYGDIDGITGYPPGGFPRTIEDWEAVIHPDDKDRIITELEKHIKGEAPYSTEYRVKGSDGRWRWWSARGTALKNDKGEPYKMIGSITDITEQKDIQNRIKFKSELLSHIGQSVVATDLQGKVIYWNNGAEGIYGWSSDDALGKSIVDLTPAEQTMEQANEIMKKLSEGNSWSGEFLVKRKDGSIFPAYVTDAPIIDSDGKLTGIIGISNDITDRKIAEESLRESHQIIEGIINSIPVRVFWKDRNLTYLGCNNLFARDAGFTNPNEIIGKDDFQMGWKNQAELYREDDRKVIESGESKLHIEEPQSTPEGNTITLLTSKIPLVNSAKETIGVLGTYIDISERKNAEEEIKKSHEELIRINAEKDKFFSIIAHDLRTPFNGFLNLTELMADTTEKFSLEEFAKYSKMLNKAARNLYLLLENLLEWAQIQKGTLSFRPGNSDLSKMVAQSIDTIYQRALQKRIEIINKINDPQNVYADEKSIGTVLRNLLSNAVKFTRMDGKVIVESKLLDDDTIEVAVADNGVGISENNVNKLFKMEEKISSIGTDGELSTGLGLLLCKEFIEMHGGKIWAESKEDMGSTFYFTLRGKKLYET